MSELRAYGRLMLLSFRALFGWLNPVIYLSSLVIGPLFQILFFAMVGRYGSPEQSTSWYAVGNAVHGCALTAVFAVGAIFNQERSAGTLGLVLITPRSRMLVFAGRALVLILHGLVTVALGFLLGWAVLGLDLSQTNWPALLLVLLLVTLTSGALGLAVSAFNLVATDVNLVLNTLVAGLLLLAGINFPPEMLPAPLRLLSGALPMTRGVAAARLAVEGVGLADLLPLIQGEALVGLSYLLLGYLLFRALEQQSRRAGTLDMY
ncbi:MAG: ABC transporter permease [Bacillota bacterium]